MGIAITEVSSPGQMRRFIELPLALYEGDPYFVPHLLSERKRFFSKKNPLFEFTEAWYFLARDEQGRLVGRTSAHVNRRHNEFWGERTGFFGFFDSVERPDVAAALMEAAETRLRERGMDRIRGPFNFSTNEECGFLAEGFDRPPALMMPYTKRYYLDFMQRLGYVKARDLVAYEYSSATGQVPEHLVRFAERIERRASVTVRPVRMPQFREEVRRAFEVYNRAWQQNWGFVPMTEAEFDYMAEELKPVVQPDLALIAEIGGEAVGFSLALPDLNPVLKRMGGRLFPLGAIRFLLGRRKVGSVRVLTMGVVPEHRRRGIESLLIYYTFKNGLARGYRHGEFSWVLEDNTLMRRALERFGARHTKTYRIFEKPL